MHGSDFVHALEMQPVFLDHPAVHVKRKAAHSPSCLSKSSTEQHSGSFRPGLACSKGAPDGTCPVSSNSYLFGQKRKHPPDDCGGQRKCSVEACPASASTSGQSDVKQGPQSLCEETHNDENLKLIKSEGHGSAGATEQRSIPQPTELAALESSTLGQETATYGSHENCPLGPSSDHKSTLVPKNTVNVQQRQSAPPPPLPPPTCPPPPPPPPPPSLHSPPTTVYTSSNKSLSCQSPPESTLEETVSQQVTLEEERQQAEAPSPEVREATSSKTMLEEVHGGGINVLMSIATRNPFLPVLLAGKLLKTWPFPTGYINVQLFSYDTSFAVTPSF